MDEAKPFFAGTGAAVLASAANVLAAIPSYIHFLKLSFLRDSLCDSPFFYE